jgi:hypothetical protein
VLPRSALKVEGSFEYQRASDGTETAVPLVFDYGLTSRLELSVEPVVASSINPDVGPSAHGAGDVETTLKWVVLSEHQRRPVIALAGEVKIPTAHSKLIGSGETDYRLFAAVSLRRGFWDLHANIGYTIVGAPSELTAENTYDYAFAAEYHQNSKLTWVTELVGNTSALGESADIGTGKESPVAPEIAGGELVALVGFRYNWRHNAAFTFGLTRDNNDAWLVRPGVSITW